MVQNRNTNSYLSNLCISFTNEDLHKMHIIKKAQTFQVQKMNKHAQLKILLIIQFSRL